jgi:hypothetical protein
MQFRRTELEKRIEELIGLLDLLDGDENLEDGGDTEPSIGCHARLMGGKLEYDLEADASDYEPTLGWKNPTCGEASPPPGWEAADGDEDGLTGTFNGDGHHIARKMLRESIKDQRKLTKAMSATRVSPGYRMKAIGMTEAEVSKQVLLFTGAVMEEMQRAYAERALQQNDSK